MRGSGASVPAALVTGGQQGIGAACVEALAAAGYDVAFTVPASPSAVARQLTERVSSTGRRVIVIEADSCDPAQVESAVARNIDELGSLDVLVNNAGVFPRRRFLDIAPAEWDEVLSTNLRGAALFSQAAARRMIEFQRPGSIVTIGSRAMVGVERGAHYAASKAGLAGLTRAMAVELAPHRIRANLVAPGMTDTAQARAEGSEHAIGARAAGLPMGRMAEPSEVAAAVVFLATPAASYVNGEVLHVNGGAYFG